MAKDIRQEAIINRIKEYALDVYGIDLDNSLRIAGKAWTIEFVRGCIKQ